MTPSASYGSSTSKGSSTSSGLPARPAIALVPGFFGFEHRGESTYFADRFVAGLRTVLETRGHTGIPVISVSTLGIASLRARQKELLQQLAKLDDRLGGPRAWHLVGHSTGGVDAAMLLRDAPLVTAPDGKTTTFGEEGWGEWADLVGRIRSVIGVAAPHFGTGLAAAPVGEFVSGDRSLTAIGQMLRAGLDTALRGDLPSRIGFALSASPPISKLPFFLAQMVLVNELARDLHPDVLGMLSSRPVRAGKEDCIFSVVTIAPRPGEDHQDKLFRDLWRWTHEGSLRTGHDLPPSAIVDDLDLRLPSQRGIELPVIDGGNSDGVATTDRQLLGTPLAVVVGDHVDVLGRYRRRSLVDGKLIDPGLLTSGAEFGDDEFFALLVRIGEQLASLVEPA